MTTPATANWLSPPNHLKLTADQVDIWQADLNLSAQQLTQFQFILSDDEQQRAERFRFDKDRNQYIAARGILRTLLGQYLDISPKALNFSYSDKGKPSLSTSDLTQPIQFNLSHSNHKALYGMTLNRQIGIDLEYMRTIEALSLAKRFFSQQEFIQLHSTPNEVRKQLFFQLWTAKEAYLKATGEGLSGLEKVEISLEKMQLLSTENPQKLLSNWSIFSLNINPEYIAAVAVAGEQLNYRYWQWQSVY
ncbi:MAG: 4'-phosphopantetheinyl transferase superfamily protein [Microcoleaceae cyanobacterium]